MPNARPDETPPPSQALYAAVRFGQRLQRLVDVVHPEERQRYTDGEIAAYVGVTPQYVNKLRRGKSVPTLDKAVRLAEFFRIESSDYFMKADGDPAVRAVERRLQALENARDDRPAAERHSAGTGADEDDIWRKLQQEHGVMEIAMRAEKLSPEARKAVLAIVDQILNE
ncbi:helix-turn-helix domain-containing protein [Streptomyces sioyaensis]|uniref:helix-turn-helix domain-containing protein n=1 Tax=Streptomyces sioyaensis TaxID=67364 RepID=UPI00365EAAB2